MNLNQMDSEQSSPSDLSDNEILAAYEEAQQRGFVFNPNSLEDDEAYDAEEFKQFFLNADGSPKL